MTELETEFKKLINAVEKLDRDADDWHSERSKGKSAAEAFLGKADIQMRILARELTTELKIEYVLSELLEKIRQDLAGLIRETDLIQKDEDWFHHLVQQLSNELDAIREKVAANEKIIPKDIRAVGTPITKLKEKLPALAEKAGSLVTEANVRAALARHLRAMATKLDRTA